MEDAVVKTIGVILGSGVIGAIITALFTRMSHTETISLKYITEERAKWRDKIKETMSELCIAVCQKGNKEERIGEIRSTSMYLRLSLNPNPKHLIDKDIISSLDSLCELKCEDKGYKEFKKLEKSVTKLLKHDWERAKMEAQSGLSLSIMFPMSVGVIWLIFYLILKNTGIYIAIQKIPYISSYYSEVALALIIFSITFAIIELAVRRSRKLKLAKYLKKLTT